MININNKEYAYPKFGDDGYGTEMMNIINKKYKKINTSIEKTDSIFTIFRLI